MSSVSVSRNSNGGLVIEINQEAARVLSDILIALGAPHPWLIPNPPPAPPKATIADLVVNKPPAPLSLATTLELLAKSLVSKPIAQLSPSSETSPSQGRAFVRTPETNHKGKYLKVLSIESPAKARVMGITKVGQVMLWDNEAKRLSCTQLGVGEAGMKWMSRTLSGIITYTLVEIDLAS